MFKLSNVKVRRAWSLVALGLVLSMLVACGGTPEPQVVVVTATNTPEPMVQVVTATFTPEPLVVTADASPTPEVVPTDTPLPTSTLPPAPTDPPPPTEPPAPELPPLEFYVYEHPSEVFSLDIPVGSDLDEDDDGVYFTYLDSLFMVFYADMGATLSPEDLEDLVTVLIEDVLMDEGMITSYDNLGVERSDSGEVVGSIFDATSEEFGEGEGSIVLFQEEQTLYMMIMLTEVYDAAEEVWERVVSSLIATPPAPVLPTSTIKPTVKPTVKPTTKPKPKPSATPKPSSSELPADKGCFLFQNQMDAEANVTFTAKDWQWSDVVFIAAGETKVYCLDPGRYAATVDVPPPWTGYNTDLEVKAGEHFNWPIYGE